MKHVWVFHDVDYNDRVEVFSNPKKAYNRLLTTRIVNMPAYSRFLRDIREYHYCNEESQVYVYKIEIE